MRTRLLLQDETENELTLRSNYLGVSLSSTILLHLVLYDDLTQLKRKDFTNFYKDYCRPLQMDIKEHVIKKYDSKARFNNSISTLLSVYIKEIVKLTKKEWKNVRCKQKTKMNFSTYQIEKSVINGIHDIKNKTGLTFTTIINYAILIEVDSLNQLSLFDEKKQKKQQGFQLSTKALEIVQGQAYKRKMNVGNLLEIKLKKAIEILDK